MSFLSMLVVGLIAFLHVYIMWFEMFQWEARGPQIFKSFPAELFSPTKVMAANQGLYNGFLAAGLIWSIDGLSGNSASGELALLKPTGSLDAPDAVSTELATRETHEGGRDHVLTFADIERFEMLRDVVKLRQTLRTNR